MTLIIEILKDTISHPDTGTVNKPLRTITFRVKGQVLQYTVSGYTLMTLKTNAKIALIPEALPGIMDLDAI